MRLISTSMASSTSTIVDPGARKTRELLLENLSILNVWLFDAFYGPAESLDFTFSKMRLEQQLL